MGSRGLATTSAQDHIARMTHAEIPSRRPTFYAPGISDRAAGEVLVLDEDESRHVRALRLDRGAPLRLTDGAGSLWEARLVAGGRSATCVLDSPSIPPLALPVELAFGVGNKAHVMWLVEKATEMGVSRLVPFESERTRSVADAGRSPAFWSKAGRRAISAMKQSGGAWLPEMEPPRPLDDYVERNRVPSGRQASDAARLVRLDGSGEGLSRVIEPWECTGCLRMVVGPEGGWSEGEVALLDGAGFRAGSLGPLVLRFETAAIAGLAVAAQRVLDRAGAGDSPPSKDAGG
jgi:16S rRNA (uracil1498-N3)-methyltransferase